MAFPICARCGEALTTDGKDLWGGFRCAGWKGTSPNGESFTPLHSNDQNRVSSDDDAYSIEEVDE